MKLKDMMMLADNYAAAIARAKDVVYTGTKKEMLRAWDDAEKASLAIMQAGYSNAEDLLEHVNVFRNIGGV